MIRLLIRLSRIGFRLAILLALIWLALPVIAQTRIDIPTSRALVSRLLADRQYQAAQAITATLMRRPNRLPADALLHARALRGIGRHRAAQDLAQHIFKTADEPRLRYSAAMVTAQALSSAGHKTRSQFWLRRAAQIAPDPQRRAKAVRDFRYVRSANPWRIDARFGISPSNNINRGPTDNTYVWNGLTFVDPSLLPLSGYEISSGVSLQHRRKLPSGNRVTLGLTLDDSQFFLSDDAKTKVPTARGSDYAFRALQTSAGFGWSGADSHWNQSLGLSFGRNWSGGSHLTDYLRTSWTAGRKINQSNRLSLRLSGERQWRQDVASRSADVLTIGGNWSHAFSGGNRLGLDVSLTNMSAASAAVAHQKSSISLSYSLGQPVFGALTSFNLGFESRLYDRALYIASRRQDNKLRLGASMFFTGFDLFGFAPKVGVTATRNNSNVSRFRTEALELSLGLQSIF